jgi:PiT family inorganic phosphate transporter
VARLGELHATVVGTRVLSPRAAVLWAAFFNLVTFLVFGTFVAKTIGGELIRISAIEKEWQVLMLL